MANPLDDLIDSARGPKSAPAAPASSGFNPFAPQPATPPAAPPPAQQPASPAPNAYQPGFLGKASNAFDDAFTLGGADWATAKVGDLLRSLGVRNATPDVATLRAQTAQGGEDIGPVARTIADAAGYAMGPGKILGPAAGRLAGGGIVSAGLEGAGAGGVSAYGHGGSLLDTLVGAGTGGAVGLGAGAVGLGAGKLARNITDLYRTGSPVGPDAVTADPGAITAALKADRNAKYDALDDVFYHPKDALDMVSKTRGDIIAKDPGGDLLANAPRTSAALQAFENQARSNPTTTGGGLGTLHRQLGEIMGGRNGGAEAEIAGPFRNRVEELMQTAQPVNPAMQPGDAADLLAQAKAAHSSYANASMLEGMGSQLDRFGNMPAPTAERELTNNPQFYPPGPADQAMMRIANSPSGGHGLGWGAHAAIAGTLGGLGLAGHPLAFAGLPAYAALSGIRGAAQRAAARRAIADAYPALTGRGLANPEQGAGELIKNLMIGTLAGGKPNPLNYVPNAAAPLVYSAF